MTSALLAKSSGETLLEHTRHCVNAARAIVDGLPFAPDVRQSILQDLLPAVVVHDSGKAATGFQGMLLGERPSWDGKRHEVLSAALASSLPSVSEPSIFAVLTHHRAIPGDHVSGGIGCLPPEQLPFISRQTPIWCEMLEEWQKNKEAALEFLRVIWRGAGLGELPEVCSILRHLRLDPLWLERGVNGQRRRFSNAERRNAALLRGLVIASDHLGSAHAVPRPIPRLDGHKLRDDCRGFQQRAAETVGSALLRAPTGSGKTDAALAWVAANQRPNGRVFYVLPYTASIDAMHHRLSAIFGNEYVGLLHSRATASLYQMLEEQDSWSRQSAALTMRNLAKEIWFPIRVSTPHQLLRWLLRGKGWELMLAEFPDACFIFDEVHAYEPRILGLLVAGIRAIQRWGARFLFISATLPRFLARILDDVAGPLTPIAPDQRDTRDRAVLDRKRHHLIVETGNVRSQLDLVRRSVHSSGSTLIVCNHVSSAQLLYDELRKECDNVVLLHSRFNREDRLRIEAALLQQLPTVLVATQVVEVSLDLDFDRAFLEPAPIDALIQRMGRVNRNRATNCPPAPIILFEEQIGNVNLYCQCNHDGHTDDCRVARSLLELRSLANPLSESDLVEAADRVYGNGYVGADAHDFESGSTHPELAKFDDRLIAGVHRSWVEDVMDASGATVDVLPSCKVDEYNRRMGRGLWIEAESLLVPVRWTTLRATGAKFDKGHELWIMDRPYNREMGLEL